LRAGEPDRAERLVRDHTMGLAAHVERHGDFLDGPNAGGVLTANETGGQ
jgi:hypothetical protein